jgi:hypothetical protein
MKSPVSFGRTVSDKLPNRRERRKLQFGAPQSEAPPSTAPKHEEFNWDIPLALAGIVVGVVLAVSPPQTRIAVLVCLIFIFVLGTHPIYKLVSFLFSSSRLVRFAFPSSLLIWCCAIGLYGRHVWPVVKRHQLNTAEIEQFEKALGPTKGFRESVQISCPDNDEAVCVCASQFITYFGQNGWDIKGAVKRKTLARPMDGIVMGERGDVKDDTLQWNTHGITKITTNVEHIYDAFDSIGISVDNSIGPNLPDGVIDVWFGEERPDESTETDFGKALQQDRAKRRWK